MGQGVDLGVLRRLVDVSQARQRVAAVDVHGAGTADALTARSAEGKGGVLLVLDLQQSIQNHGSADCTEDSSSRLRLRHDLAETQSGGNRRAH